jgi:anti-sigma regulatory factor (Ser/Thr protein kinase)
MAKRLPADTRSVPLARHWALGRAAALGIADQPFLEALSLLVTETVTNAILHGRSEVDVELSVRALADGTRAVRVDVVDDDDALPLLAPVDVEAAGGRGLQLLHQIADAHGVAPRPAGKAVWFELHVPA